MTSARSIWWRRLLLPPAIIAVLIAARHAMNESRQRTRASQLPVALGPDELKLPGVAEVTVHGAVNPSRRIIHILDRHFVTRDAYAADLRAESPEPLPDAEINKLYDELLLEVESVQATQKAVLRYLIKQHGVTGVFVEGLTDADVEIFKAKVLAVGALEGDVARAREERAALAEILADDPGDTETAAVIQELDAAIEQHRRDLLQIGAAGQLWLARELHELLPLEDADAYKAANPLGADGSVTFDVKLEEAREDAQVRRMLAGPRLAVVVLGEAHDLAYTVERVVGAVQYVRVAVDSPKETNAPRGSNPLP